MNRNCEIFCETLTTANSTKFTLKIIPFTNPSGNLAYRVTGMVYGERVQKNFPTFEEARTFMNVLIAYAGQGESSPTRIATTTLMLDADLHEAQMAWQRLRTQVPKGSLITAVDSYLSHAGDVIKDCGTLDAIDRFAEHRRSRGNQDNTVETTNSVLKKFVRVAKVSKISDFTREVAQ